MAKKTEKIRYEIDPHNRLIYEKTGKKSNLPGIRAVLDGRFKIDKNSQLTYHVKKSRVSDIPQQLKLRGEWSLDKAHNLVFTLNKWGNQIAGNKLILKSDLIDAKDNMLSFELTSKDSADNTHIYILKLGGRWQTDKHNRLLFDIKKEKGTTDRLTFEGAWDVNKQNRIIYACEQSSGGQRKRIRAITLKGYWDIAGKHRILYVLNREIKSECLFRVSLGRPVGRGLQYQIGIGARPAKKTITLFGTWKLNRKRGLLFEMPCGEGKVHKIVLGGWGRLGKNCNLEIRLEDKAGEDLGVNLKLSKKIFKGQGEAFIRGLKSEKEVAIAAGVGFRF